MRSNLLSVRALAIYALISFAGALLPGAADPVNRLDEWIVLSGSEIEYLHADVEREKILGTICGRRASYVAKAQSATMSSNHIRIMVGGILHESNTFCPLMTTEKDFTLRRGKAVLSDPEAEKLFSAANAELVPTLIARAEPYGVVARATYEKFRAEILDGARRAGRLDGIYLEMHGAMHVDGYPDAQADFIRALRRVVGDDVLIAASFDLHGNVSEEFAKGLNIATAFRTAPHVDQKETRLRAMRLLLEAIRSHSHPVVVSLRVPMLIEGERAITAVEPLRSIYAQLPEASKKKGILDASILVGHTFQDAPRVSMRVLVVADDEANCETAMDEARQLGMQLWEKRAELKFDVPTDTIDGAIDMALKAPEKTVIITDSGDNITAGAAGDSTLALVRLQAKHVRDAVLAGIVDPDDVLACEKAGPGHHVRFLVGGEIDTAFSKPYELDGTVVRITPSSGANGRTAVVDANGILIVLLDRRRAFTAPEQFREVGIDPLEHKIVIVKEGYLFQALRDIAPRTIMALTPGSTNPLIEHSSYKHLIRPIYPLDPDMTWKP